jgi:hypothetical protein
MGHVDVMPTILEVIEGHARPDPAVEGISAFQPRSSLLLSTDDASTSAPGLVFLSRDRRTEVAYYAGTRDSQPDTISLWQSSDANRRPLPAGKQELLQLLFTSFPDVARQVFDAGTGPES